MKLKNVRSKIIKIFIFIIVLLLFCLFNCSYAEDTQNEIYLEEDDYIYEVNLNDSNYIERLEEDLEKAEEQQHEQNSEIEEQESKIEELEEKLQTMEIDQKNKVQNLWICFIFIFLIGIYISYQVGLDKK